MLKCKSFMPISMAWVDSNVHITTQYSALTAHWFHRYNRLISPTELTYLTVTRKLTNIWLRPCNSKLMKFSQQESLFVAMAPIVHETISMKKVWMNKSWKLLGSYFEYCDWFYHVPPLLDAGAQPGIKDVKITIDAEAEWQSMSFYVKRVDKESAKNVIISTRQSYTCVGKILFKSHSLIRVPSQRVSTTRPDNECQRSSVCLPILQKLVPGREGAPV